MQQVIAFAVSSLLEQGIAEFEYVSKKPSLLRQLEVLN